MSWYPHARKRPLRFAGSLPARQLRKAVILHTNGGGTDHGSLFGWFNRPGNDIAAHFQVMNDGTVEQYIDTSHEAYAEFAGNRYAIAIETEDDGHPERPWTASQLASIVAICKWVGCPPRELADGPSDGVGWHSQYRDNDRSGHACPGPVRIQQIVSHVIPALRAPAPAAYDFRPLKCSAVALAELLHIPEKVDVTEPTKGTAFVDLLCTIGRHPAGLGVDYAPFKHWLVSAANGLHIPHDGVIASNPAYGKAARDLTFAIARHR